jgi:predicted outer membrane repeat protein
MQGGRVQANRADIGGGLYISGGASADGSGTITDVALLENVAEGDYGIGGAFTCNGGHCVIRGGLIRDNRATTGGALYFYKPEARVEIEDAEIAINSASLGGGIYGRAGEARIENSILRQNTATLDGGAIHADGASIRVIGGRMTNNGATRDGGAVHSGENGTVIIEGGWLANNGATRHGGALVAQKKIAVVGSTLRENTADGTESLGGMALVTDAGVLEISDSLVAANTGLQGGAVAISGTLKAQNSTFSGNVALEGGAIFNAAGSAQLASVTISANRAEGGEGETAGAAGIHSATGAGAISLRNSIVAVNPGGKDCSRALTSEGNNIDSDGSCGLGAAGDLADQTPGLEDLDDNGGPSLTHALLPASVAVDAGNAAGCMAVVTAGPIEKDQRGIARSLDGKGDGKARCDIGAYELDPDGNPPPPLGHPIYLPTLRRGE